MLALAESLRSKPAPPAPAAASYGKGRKGASAKDFHWLSQPTPL